MNFTEANNLCQSQGANVRLAILDTTQAFNAVKYYWKSEFFWVSAEQTSNDGFVWTNGAGIKESFWSYSSFDFTSGCVGLDTGGLSIGLKRDTCRAGHLALCQQFVQTGGRVLCSCVDVVMRVFM